MTRKNIAQAWEEGFWFATFRLRKCSPFSASRGIAFKCAELIGHDRFMAKVGRQRGGKGSM